LTVVLHVLEALEGGTARHVRDLVEQLPEVDHHVALPRRRVGGVTDETAGPAMAGAGAQLHWVEMRRFPPSARNGLALARLVRLIRRLRPEVIHGHSSIGGALARVAAVVSGTGAEVFYTPNGLYPSAPAAAAERVLGRATDRFIAVSQGEARLAAVRGLVPEDRLSVIPNGIDLSPEGPSGHDLRAELGLQEGSRLVGFVGRLAAQKAPEVLVQAAAVGFDGTDQEGPHFVLIGGGPREAAVRDLIDGLGLAGRVHCLGHRSEARALMAQFDVFALPSRYEGCPYSVLEAMRAGVPVAASEVTGNRDLVDHGRTGLLFPAGDASSLAAAIDLLLGDGPLARSLTAAARAGLAERFDVVETSRAVLRLYQRTGA
jgi:glycosyltransferase involved in cell wall biosynthesis